MASSSVTSVQELHVPSFDRDDLQIEPPDGDQRLKAARCLLKVWRGTRTGIALLHKFGIPLAKLPHGKFRRVWHEALLPLLKQRLNYPQRRETVEHALETFHTARQQYQKQSIFPICSSIPGKGSLPTIKMSTENEVKGSYRRFGHFLLTPEACSLFQNMTQASLDKPAIDAIARAFGKLDLMTFEYCKEGCSARTRIMIELLQLCGVSLKKIGKIVVIVPDLYKPSKPKPVWSYHMAAYVELPNGEKCIIDPCLEKSCSINQKDWIALQSKPYFQFRRLKIVDKGQLSIWSCCGNTQNVSYDTSKCLVFTMDPFTKVIHLDEEKGKVKIETFKDHGTGELASHQKRTLAALANYRCLAEKEWYDNLVKRRT